MHIKSLLLLLVCVGMVSLASAGWWGRRRRSPAPVIVHAPCKCCHCVSCCNAVIVPIHLLTRELGHSLIATGRSGYAKSQQLATDDHKVDPTTFLSMCDANEDEVLSRDEFEGCLKHSGDDVNERFNNLDNNHDEKLSMDELKHFGVSMQGSKDCYLDMITRCAAQFVMYERVRGVTKRSLCEGLHLYEDCIEASVSNCTDPRTHKLDRIFSWTMKQLEGTCDEDAVQSSNDQTATQRGTVHCLANLLHRLHGSEPPCVAMATFDECLKNEADAKDEEMIFEDVVQLTSCDYFK